MLQLNFQNKTALVTGSTRGIGKKIAEDLMTLGARVLLTGTSQDEIDKLNLEAKNRGYNKKYYCVNFSNSNDLTTFIKNVKKSERVDIIVNNAGINRLNSIENIQNEDIADMLAVNLVAPLLLIKEFSALMKKNGYGRILNVASIFSKVSKEKRSLYSLTKSGLHGLTVGSSIDLARYNILINSISPGFIMTELTKKNLSKNEIKAYEEVIPAKRLGTVEDVSKLAVFLISDLNQYLTGQNIIIDGGFTNI
jgi:NAD(P)-dependent dehydrogenase (short-subunit alcohol dehydrogenase family)